MTSGLEKDWRHIYSRVLNDVWRARNITLVNNMNYTEPSLNACELFSGRMCVDTSTLHLLNRFRHHAPSAIWSGGRVRQILRENFISELPLLYSDCLKFSEDDFYYLQKCLSPWTQICVSMSSLSLSSLDETFKKWGQTSEALEGHDKNEAAREATPGVNCGLLKIWGWVLALFYPTETDPYSLSTLLNLKNIMFNK